jgi:hypothetical protein
VKFAVEAWAPDYSASVGEIGRDADVTATVECGVEVPTASWAPRAPVPSEQVIAFVDGISRVEAQVWIDDGEEHRPGICASYAAGAVVCDGRATVTDVRVGRGLFTSVGSARPIVTRHATYELKPSAGDLDVLSLAVVERMRALEADVARAVTGADLVVLDGLLWGRADVPNAIGYVKSHHAPYLPAELNGIVGALASGERTPLFLIRSGGGTRFSWYARLPCPPGHPWSGIVRCEASAESAPADVAELADRATANLPRFASAPHKDPRAPQNLIPIAGLERELRRRAGNPELLYRALREAAHAAAVP